MRSAYFNVTKAVASSPYVSASKSVFIDCKRDLINPELGSQCKAFDYLSICISLCLIFISTVTLSIYKWVHSAKTSVSCHRYFRTFSSIRNQDISPML